jgi:hypothetical protein
VHMPHPMKVASAISVVLGVKGAPPEVFCGLCTGEDKAGHCAKGPGFQCLQCLWVLVKFHTCDCSQNPELALLVHTSFA